MALRSACAARRTRTASGRGKLRCVGPVYRFVSRAVVVFVLNGAVAGALFGSGCASFRETGGYPDGGDAEQEADARGSASSGSSGVDTGSGGSDGGSGATSSGSGSDSGAARSGGSDSGSGSGGSDSGAASSGGSDSGNGSGGSDGGGVDASGLDPSLVLPDPSGAPCADPGSLTECSGSQVCRISSTTGGACEGCTNCGNLHAPCTADADCDILFQCYLGFCDGFCQLSTPQECGAPSDCTNVGNSTTGICKYP
jgi:hypothetical protein